MPLAEQLPLRLIIDTDIGVDDAVAIMLALRSPAARVEAITTVSGNIDAGQCVRNARYVLELCERELPVYRGASRPLAGAPRPREAVHGSDGLGDLGLRPSRSDPDPGAAHERLVELARTLPGGLTLVTLGPLTNLALALRLAPRLPLELRRVVMMGGAAQEPGTVTPPAEFNIWSDPAAAKEVFAAGLCLTMVPIDLSLGAAAHSPEDQAHLAALDTPLASFVMKMCSVAAARQGAGVATAGLPDAIAMAIALDPTLVQRSSRYFVDIEPQGEFSTGETVVDYLGLTRRPPNVEIVEEIDAERYKAMLLGACRQ